MSDKIKVSTDHLDQLVSQLKSLGNKLGSASNNLSGISMNSTTANYAVRQGSCSLSGNAGISRISLGSTSLTVRRYSDVLDSYDDLCKQLAKNVSAVKERFTAIEAELSALANGDAEEIGAILGFQEDSSQWTDSQWNSYLNFSNDYHVTELPGGGKIYSKDGHIIFIDQSGNVQGEFDFGDFLFWNNPFDFRPGIPIPNLNQLLFYPGAAITGLIPGTAGEGVLSKLEAVGFDVNSKIQLVKEKSGQKGLLTNSKGEKVDTIKKQFKDGKWVESDEGVKKAKHTFVEVGLNKSDYGGLLMTEGKYEGENGSVSGKAALGYGEYSMGGYVGLYGYDENGNVVLAPGVRGEIGGSVSVLHADVEGSYDFGEVEVGGSVAVDVGKVGLKGKGQLGWVDGKFAANAGFEAEAIAFEVEGSVSASNDYIGVKATGGVQFGVGVSGDVGYHDGVISVEFSAAAGLGFSGKVDLDISGTIDAVTDAAESVAENVTKGVQSFFRGAETIGNWLFG